MRASGLSMPVVVLHVLCVCIISCDVVGFKTVYIHNYRERNVDLVGCFQFPALVILLDSIIQKWPECHRRFAREA